MSVENIPEENIFFGETFPSSFFLFFWGNEKKMLDGEKSLKKGREPR